MVKQFVEINALLIFEVSACKDPESFTVNTSVFDNTKYTFSSKGLNQLICNKGD